MFPTANIISPLKLMSIVDNHFQNHSDCEFLIKKCCIKKFSRFDNKKFLSSLKALSSLVMQQFDQPIVTFRLDS